MCLPGLAQIRLRLGPEFAEGDPACRRSFAACRIASGPFPACPHHPCASKTKSFSSLAPARTRGWASLDGAGRNSVWRALGVLFRSPTALLLTAGFTAIVFVNNAYVVWAPVFLQERFHLSLTQAGGFAMFFHHLAALLGILFCGWLSDRRALTHPVFRPQLMTAAMLIGAPAIFLMGQAGTLVLACAAMAAFGLFRGIYEANTHALFQVISPRYRASAVGIMTMLAFLAGSLSPWLLGALRESSPPMQGLGIGFSALSGAYLVGGLAVLSAVLFTFHRDRCPDEAN